MKHEKPFGFNSFDIQLKTKISVLKTLMSQFSSSMSSNHGHLRVQG